MIAPNEHGRATEVTPPDGVTPGRASTTAPNNNDATGYTEPPAHDPSQCECNSWGMGRPPCPDCKAVFAAKREQLLASIRENDGQDDSEGDVLWYLGDPIYDGENDQREDVT